MNDPDQVLAAQRRVAGQLGLPVARRHLLCCDQTKPNCSTKERSLAAWEFLKRRLGELGLAGHGGVYRTKANCLRICTGGPIAVVYPKAPGMPAAIRQCSNGSSRSI